MMHEQQARRRRQQGADHEARASRRAADACLKYSCRMMSLTSGARSPTNSEAQSAATQASGRPEQGRQQVSKGAAVSYRASRRPKPARAVALGGAHVCIDVPARSTPPCSSPKCRSSSCAHPPLRAAPCPRHTPPSSAGRLGLCQGWAAHCSSSAACPPPHASETRGRHSLHFTTAHGQEGGSNAVGSACTGPAKQCSAEPGRCAVPPRPSSLCCHISHLHLRPWRDSGSA